MSKPLPLTPASQETLETARKAAAAALPGKDTIVYDAQAHGVWIHARIKDGFICAEDAWAAIRAVTDAIADAIPNAGDASYNVYNIGSWYADANFFNCALQTLPASVL